MGDTTSNQGAALVLDKALMETTMTEVIVLT